MRGRGGRAGKGLLGLFFGGSKKGMPTKNAPVPMPKPRGVMRRKRNIALDPPLSISPRSDSLGSSESFEKSEDINESENSSPANSPTQSSINPVGSGGPISNVVTGALSPVMETPRSKKTTKSIIKSVRDGEKLVLIGHSEGGQNVMRALQKRSVSKAISDENLVSPTASDGSWDEELSVEAMRNMLAEKKKAEAQLRESVEVITLGSPSAKDLELQKNALLKGQKHYQNKDDLVGAMLYGDGRDSDSVEIISQGPGGHSFESSYQEAFQKEVEDALKQGKKVVHHGGMFTSQDVVKQRLKSTSISEDLDSGVFEDKE